MPADHTHRHIPVHGILVALACVLIGLMAAQPLLFGNLPFGADTLLHLYRAVQLDELVKQGVWYSRWAPDLAFGYGYPLFNYYAPGVYYLVEALHLLGLGFVPALMGACTLLLVAAALFTYLFVRDLTSSAGAFIAAAGYACAPYMILMTVHTGSISQVAAMAILPAVFWAFRRATLRRSIGAIIIAAIAFAALMLCHNITTFLATPFLVAQTFYQPKNLRALCAFKVKSSLPAVIALALGFGLTAFYWLPVLTETSLVQLDRTIISTAFDFHANFVTVADLFALPHTYDPRLIGEALPYAFSLPVVAVAVIGGIALIRRRAGVDWAQVVFALTTVLLCIFLTTPASQPLWDAVPMMRFVQFPTRILTIASLFLAVLAGMGVEGLCVQCPNVGIPLLVLVFAVYAFFWQNVTRYPPLPQPTIADFTKYERENGWIGTTSLGEYLPATARTMPAQTVVGQARFNVTSLSPGADVRDTHSNPLDHSATVASAAPWIAQFNVFMFPGWVAEIDGQVAPITATDPQGLISVSVPAGLHEVAIHFRETPARALADALSLVCVAVTTIGAVFVLRRSGPKLTVAKDTTFHNKLTMQVCIGAIIIALLVVKTTVIDTQDTFFYRSLYDGTRVSGARQDLTINFDHKLDLIGVDAPEYGSTVENATVTLYWRALQPPPENLSVGVELADSQGNVVGRSDHLHPAGFPVIRWDPKRYAADTYHITLKPGTPPGPYTYKVNVYPYDQPVARLAAFDKNGLLTGTTFDSLTVNVITTTLRRAAMIAGSRPLTPQITLDADINPNAVLIGFDLPVTSTVAGERLPLTLYWRVGAAPASDWGLTWVLAKADGSSSSALKTGAIAGYPTNQWVAGDVWRAPHSLRIPTATTSGHYRLSVGATGNSPVYLADIEVSGFEHVMAPPAIAHTQSARFNDGIELVGYDLPATARPGDVITVTLLWHAFGETEMRYKTFVHLVDAGDNRVTGVDSAPVNGVRPTSGWMQGEYIVDARRLQIPKDLAAGTYSIKVGLYNENTLQRLTLADGRGHPYGTQSGLGGANIVTLVTPVWVVR